MKIHILGICGTFMAGIAQLAKAMGHEVSGCDARCYPPMTDVLQKADIDLIEGYEAHDLPTDIDCFVVGNAMKRGMPIIETILNHKYPYQSGPQWLADNVLPKRRVIGVSGTHGKTTTSAMIAWILQAMGHEPGFLIAGALGFSDSSARLGKGEVFVLEADEYDSAFFDKRPKFTHYHPDIAVLTNLEFDHGDIYADLDAIKQQFHYLIRTIPGNGCLITNGEDDNLADVLKKGVWTPTQTFGFGQGVNWQGHDLSVDTFECLHQGQSHLIEWALSGQFNAANALAAIAACNQVGISPQDSARALGDFIAVKRRMEKITAHAGCHLYDDFAHHPTAIEATLKALKQRHPKGRLWAIVQFGSYTMRHNFHQEALHGALRLADEAVTFGVGEGVILPPGMMTFSDESALVACLKEQMRPKDTCVVMGNKRCDALLNKLRTVVLSR